MQTVPRKPGAAIVVCLLMVLGHLSFAAYSVRDIAGRVDKHYNSLRTFEADFVEIYSGNGIERQESGKLSLKRPDRMRWDYRQPVEKLFVSDGKTAYFYVPGEKQARRTSMKNLDDLRSPLRYLLGKTKLEKEFDKLSISDGAHILAPGNLMLSGIPKQMADRVRKVSFEITPKGQISRILIEEVDGALTEFRFSNIIENRDIAEAQFHFAAGKGVETIEAGPAFSF